jgi:acetoacetyl-CoA synthetase
VRDGGLGFRPAGMRHRSYYGILREVAVTEPKLLWTPTPEWLERTTLKRYQAWLDEKHDLQFESYHDLWRWSVFDLEAFWSSLVEFLGVRFSEGGNRVLGSSAMPDAKWFPGSRLSYAEHMFAGKDPRALAIQHASESRELASMTWGDLRSLTASIAVGLRASGVVEGDRVAAYMPNIPETVAALFACASIGAVWSSAAPEFGVRSVVDRFAQIEPKVLLAVDGYRYGGKDFDRRDAVDRIAGEIPSLSRVVRLGYLSGSGWDEGFLGPADSELEFAQLPFDHPLWVLYSSGTTGLPKPIVHGQGGILLEHLKKAWLHLDAQSGDRMFWFTTTGWMMWNFIVGVLLSDASIVLFDGNPGYPSLGTLWDLAADSGMTCFGTSAAFIGACMNEEGLTLREGRDLSALRSVGSTGSPLSPEGFQWIYDQLGSDTWLFSTSGGTDLCTAFVGGVPTLPVYLGELQARALGASVESWDPEGRPQIGEVGELVITRPMPSMPVFFWGDDSGERYRESYFEMYPGIWRHGDWIEITPRETAIIYGRSDSTINRGGIRMGTSEIYRAVLAVDAVTDALVVDIPREGREAWMPLFVVLREGASLDDSLVSQIRRRIREDCSPRHVPDEIRQIDEVPRTLSGKVLEVPVKRILMGIPPEEAASRESLANPAALDYFVALAN